MKLKPDAVSVSDGELDVMYREMLNDVYGTVKIAGLEFETADALISVDPVAYRCGFSDYISSLLDDSMVEVDGEYYWSDDVAEDE
jgi:hypothetical protein